MSFDRISNHLQQYSIQHNSHSDFAKHIIAPAILGDLAGKLYISTGAHVFYHEYFGHRHLGCLPIFTKVEFSIVNDDYTYFKMVVNYALRKNVPTHKRIIAIAKLAIPKHFGGQLNLKAESNFFGSILRNNLCVAWLTLSAPILESLTYNYLLSLGTFLIVSGENKDVRPFIGIGLCSLALNPLIYHLHGCGYPYKDPKNINMHLKKGLDVEVAAIAIRKATNIHPFKTIRFLRTSFMAMPALSISYAIIKGKTNSKSI